MSDEADAAAAVAALVNAVNAGDFDLASRAFTDDAMIVEDLPPYRWSGPAAVSQWLAAMGENAAKLGVTSINLDIGESGRTEVEGNRAYVIVDGLLRLGTAGAELSATGALTVTLEKPSDAWLIETLVWSGPRPD
jgi:ketosteroid isomerase-like protein